MSGIWQLLFWAGLFALIGGGVWFLISLSNFDDPVDKD